jgi:hypothetical protein
MQNLLPPLRDYVGKKYVYPLLVFSYIGLAMKTDCIYKTTIRVFNEWKEPYGWSPNSAAEKLCAAMKHWIVQLTDCLHIWELKGLEMSDGELILARVNLGSLVECWLKFFYCIYCEDYYRDSRNINQNNKVKEPEDLSLEQLKVYSRTILWEQGDKWDIWIEKIQLRRNAIHAFKKRDIGDNSEFLSDLNKFFHFLDLIKGQLPDSPKYARENLSWAD